MPRHHKKNQAGYRRKQPHQKQEEIKFVDTKLSSTDIDTSGYDLEFSSLIAQGTSQNDRIGNVVRLKEIETNLIIKHNNSSRAGLRMIVFWDHNNTYTALSDLLVDESDSTNFISLRNRNSLARYKVLYDRTYQVDGVYRDKLQTYRKIRVDKEVRYEYSGTTVTSGVLRILFISGSSSTATDKMKVQAFIRLKFTE